MLAFPDFSVDKIEEAKFAVGALRARESSFVPGSGSCRTGKTAVALSLNGAKNPAMALAQFPRAMLKCLHGSTKAFPGDGPNIAFLLFETRNDAQGFSN